jgi:molybdopterin synthase sulfur carrier subunit
MPLAKSFRGITLRLAVHYLENLGGDCVAGDPETSDDARVEAPDWTATLSTDTVAIGPTVRLTEVTVEFEGQDDVVADVVDRFSQKAMRAGG